MSNGKYFEPAVKKGDLLIAFDKDAIQKEGYKVTTPMIILNTDDYKEIIKSASGNINTGDNILKCIG